MHNTRRNFLKKTASIGTFCVFSISTLFIPKNAQGKWLEENFKADSFDKSLKHLFNDAEIIDSNKIKLKLPKTAENGAVVPITIKSNLDNINKIYILVEKNPVPLAAEFDLSPHVDVYIKARIKMAESCDVVVIAASDEQLYRTRKSVKVTVGGCGG